MIVPNRKCVWMQHIYRQQLIAMTNSINSLILPNPQYCFDIHSLKKKFLYIYIFFFEKSKLVLKKHQKKN